MGIIQASTTLGGDRVCAAVVPQLVKLPTGWRTIYFVGAAPLFLVMLARREMRETKRFEVQLKAVGERARSFFDILRGAVRAAHRARRVGVGALLRVHAERDHVLEGVRGRRARDVRR
jgi:hypothetical protein